MRNPAGAECPLYYEDFARGAARQECRGITSGNGAAWRPSDCTRCPVPEILAANGSPYLVLGVSVKPGFLGLGRHVEVTPQCSLHGHRVRDPRIGCDVCNRESEEILKRGFE